MLKSIGSILRTSEREPLAEAKKADGATCVAVRMPRPPSFTGRQASLDPSYVIDSEVNITLTTLLKI